VAVLVREECPHGLVAAGKASQNVEDQDVLQDRKTEVAKPINRALHLPAVVAHGHVTLLERAKLGVELEGVCLSILEKLSLEGKPHHARGGIRSARDVLKIQGDGPRDPGGHDDAIAVSPRRVASTDRSVEEDVAVEGVAAKNEELVPPSSVGGGVGVEDDGDQGLDVRDPGGLKVEVGDHGVVRVTRGCSTQLEWSRWRRGGDTLPRRGVEEALRFGDLASKSVNGGTLVLPGEGGHTHALLGGCCRGLGVLQGCSEAVVGGRDGGGTRRQHMEEGGGGERAGRRRCAVDGTGAAKQQGATRACAHNPITSARRSTTTWRNPSRGKGGGGGDSGVGAAHRGHGRGAGEGGSQDSSGLGAAQTPGDA
jgi:hypothetical protein